MFDSRTRLANDVADEIRKHYPHELIDILFHASAHI